MNFVSLFHSIRQKTAATAVCCLIAGSMHIYADEPVPPPLPQSDTKSISRSPVLNVSLDISGFTINGDNLARSGYDWADNNFVRNVPIFFIAFPSLSVQLHPERPKPGTVSRKDIKLISFSWLADGVLSPAGIMTGASVSCSITPFFTLTAASHISSSWNYGSTFVTIATYNPDNRKYDTCTSLSGAAYSFAGTASAMLPLPARNMLQFTYSSEYTGFTRAENGEPWKCGMNQNSVNGWKFTASAMASHMFTKGSIKMTGITFSAGGWYSSSYYDDIYQPYNPSYVTFTITPMIRLQPAPKQSVIVMAVINRERRFENDSYTTNQTLLQTYTGSRWQFKTFMCIWHIQLR